MTFHEQIPFVCVDGEITEVDAGMVDILSSLSAHNVKTLYSCQGQHDCEDEDDRAYVSMRLLTAVPLMVRIAWSHFSKKYSSESRLLIKKFVYGYWQVYTALNKNNGTYRIVSFMFDIRDIKLNHMSEFSMENNYGLRICFRWPPAENEAVLKLLNQTPHRLHVT